MCPPAGCVVLGSEVATGSLWARLGVQILLPNHLPTSHENSGYARVNDCFVQVGDRSVPLLEWIHLSCRDVACHSADVNTTPLELV